MANYADVEELLTTWLKQVTGFVNVAHEIPTNLQFRMPLVVVERYGGGDNTVTLDAANVDIDVFAADRSTAKLQAENIRRAVRMQLPGYHTGNATVSKVETISGPAHRPWDSRAAVRRFGATYRLTIHSRL